MTKHTIVFHITVISLLSLLLSCNGQKSRFAKQLQNLDTLMQQYPDSAYRSLLGMSAEAEKQSRSLRMRYALTIADAQNKAYVDFTTDSVMKEVAEYYDTWGNDAERMRSHYLLGCVYRDKGDAPYAIRCFTDALSFADTTNANCDYRMLGKIYGQMTDAYIDSYLPTLALETAQKSIDCMNKMEEKLSELSMKLDILRIYNNTGKDSASAHLGEKLISEYRMYGYERYSYIAYQDAINSYIKLGDMGKATSLLAELDDILIKYNYDEQTIDFSHYYCYKARCYEHVNLLDSALYYCNKALSTKYSHAVAIHAYGCLMSIYEKKHDYVLSNKYARLYCAANDSSLIHHSLDAVNKLHAEYNYNRAEKIKTEAERKLYLTYVIMVMTFLFLAMSVVWGRHRYCMMRRRQQSEIIAINKEYGRLLRNYGKAQNEYNLLQTNFDSYMQEKENCIKALRKQLEEFASNIADSEQPVMDDKVINSNLMRHIRRHIADGITPTNDEIRGLKTLIEENYPVFWSTVTHPQYNLTEQEIRACIFMRLFFIPSEIAFVMSMSLQRVTNIKSRVKFKLFGEKGAKGLVEKLSKLN